MHKRVVADADLVFEVGVRAETGVKICQAIEVLAKMGETVECEIVIFPRGR
jgi:hypothetical protein